MPATHTAVEPKHGKDANSRVGAAHAPEETAADHLAETLVGTSAPVKLDCPACAAGPKPCPACAAAANQIRRSAIGPGPTAAPGSVGKALAQPGVPLPAGLRDRFERRLGTDLAPVRLHTGQPAATAARDIQARAFAAGPSIVLGARAPAPDTPAGERLLAHEVSHIVLGHGGVRRNPDDATSGPVCEPRVGTFVFDPALANVEAPSNMSISVKVEGPNLTGAPTVHHVTLDRHVLSTQRLQVFLTPASAVFETWVEAQSQPPMTSAGPVAPRVIDPLAPAFTASGPIQVIEQRGEHVLTATANTETVAAGTVVLINTSGGTVLLDAGMQCLSPADAPALGEAMADRLVGLVGSTPISEAVLAPGAPSGHLLPHLAGSVGILSIRGTAGQETDGSINAVLAAQQGYRSWYAGALRDQLQAQRSDWERTQPLAPTQDVRDQRWAAYMQSVLATDPVLAGTAVGIARNSGSAASAVLDEATETRSPPAADASGALDLTDSAWEPDPTPGQMIVYGDGRITTFPAAGFVLRPAAAPLNDPVPGLHASGPQGLAPASPRAVTPWLALPAVGKEGLTQARLGTGLSILIDAGGPRAITMAAVAQMQTQLGVTNIQQILLTHVHDDHTRQLVELIKAHNIRAADLVTSSGWRQAGTLRELTTTTDPVLVGLGYGAGWNPTIAVGGSGVQHTRVGTGAGQIDVYARASAHQDLDAAYTARATGARRSVPSPMEDSAGFLYVHGNESSPTRHAVFADFRGEDITGLRDGMGATGFADAMRNVRVVSGLGHHLSSAAGRTPGDIEGMNLLLEQTLQRNGELTLLIQSREGFAFDGPSTRTGSEGALLDYLQRQGVRVVFAGAPTGTNSTDTATLDSNRGLNAPAPGASGTGIQVFNADPQLQAAYRRLNLLREALRTVGESPEFAAQALEQPGQTSAQLQTALQADITRIETLLAELRGVAAADLLDARAPNPGGRDHTSATNRAAFRNRMSPGGRSASDILTDLAQVQPAEAALNPAVQARLQLALDHGRAISLPTAFAAMPRDLATAAEALPPAQRDALGRQYRELADLTRALESGQVPADRRVDVLARAMALRDQLQQWQGSAAEGQRATIGGELARVEGIVNTLKAQAHTDVMTGRDAQGRITRTEFIRMGGTAPAGADAAVRGFHAVGQAMGAMMVIHSVQEAVTAVAGGPDGNASVPERLLHTAHAAYGMHIGVRMATASLRQAAAGSGGVATWEFAVLAVFEVGAAATADYQSAEERNAAVASSAIHASVNMLCMMAGQSIMVAGAEMPSHPLIKAGVMGLGLAVTMAGEKILSLFGLDERVERWASYPPGSVTEVNQNINRVLGDYRALIGNRRLQARTDEELRQLGVTDVSAFRAAAQRDAAKLRADLSAKESELTGLFESAYGDARGAWVGLPVLDQQAAEFTRLRAEARGNDPDPNRENLDARWRAIDAKLDMSKAGTGEIDRLSQWATLDEELDTVESLLNTTPVDHAKLFTHLERVHLTLENARYRLAPHGGPRSTAMLPEGSPGRARYVNLLEKRERRDLNLQVALASASGHELPVQATLSDISPPAALARLRAVRAAYDAEINEAAGQLPNLGKRELWNDLAALTRAAEDANNAHPDLFNQLRMAEAALQAAATQARSAPSQVQPPLPPDIGPPAPAFVPANLRFEIDTEVNAAFLAMEQRRTHHGLIFRTEIDALVVQQSARQDTLLAARIDAGNAAPGTSQARPFSEEEINALRQGDLADQGSRLTSTAHQLGEQRRLLMQLRSDEARTMDYTRMNRSMERQFVGVSNPYRYLSTGLFDTYPEASYDASLNPVVTGAGKSTWGANGTFGGPAMYTVVMPINADAVKAFGPQPIAIRHTDFKRLRPEDEARYNAPVRQP